MKKVFENKIINIDENLFDNKLLFCILKKYEYENNVDIKELLKKGKNTNIDYKKDYKLWNEVYSPKNEYEIFKKIVDDTILNNKKIHISNISLKEEIELIKTLYDDLGYFDKDLNCYKIDFINSPITIGVNIRNIIFSFKDYKKLKDSILFVPPPREPRHQKAIRSAINSGIISTIEINNIKEETMHLNFLIKEERIDYLKLGKNLYYNYIKRGFKKDFTDLILQIN